MLTALNSLLVRINQMFYNLNQRRPPQNQQLWYRRSICGTNFHANQPIVIILLVESAKTALQRLHWKKIKYKKGLGYVLRSLCTDFKHPRHLLLSPIRKSVKTALLRHYGGSCGAEKSKRIKKMLLYVLKSLCNNFQHNYHFFLIPDKNPLKRRFCGVGSGAYKSERDK